MKRWQKILAAVAAVLLVALIVLSFVLDGILTSKAHDEAQKLSAQLGRPVTIDAVATKLLTGFGVRVSGVRIGAAQGESAPLLDLQRAEVKVALLRALFTGGKSVEVRSAEVSGLTVHIVKLPDGTTNLERLQEKLASPKEQQQPKKESDLSFLRVDHAELAEGQVELIDQSKGAAKSLGVQHLDVRVDDLRVGKPLEVVVKAAVLAQQQNFELHLKAAPLPRSLTPTPVAVTLKVAPPIDLTPLGPFAGKSVGLEAGTLDANFDAQLGGAAPGGSGPTKVKGTVKLAGLRFAGSEGGKPLDVLLDTDVDGDVDKGDLALNKLQLDFGPAGISGHGRASGINTPEPRIEGLEIVAHDLDPARLAAYSPPLRKQLNGMISGPIGLRLGGSGSQAAQTLELRVDFTPVALRVPEQLVKSAGAPMVLLAHAQGAAAANGPVKFDLQLDLTGVDLRPGESLDKKPGDRMDVNVVGTRSGERIDLHDVKTHLIDDELEASGFFQQSGQSKKFDLRVASSHLDLDRLLIANPPKKEKKPTDPAAFAGLSGHAAVKIDRVTYKKQALTDVVADVTLEEDDLRIKTASVKAFGGTADASGTELKLAHPDQPFHVVTKMQGFALQNALALVGDRKVLGGTFNGGIDLHGGGEAVKDLAQTLSGTLDGHLLDGVFYGKDLVGGVTGPLAKSLPFGLAGKQGQGGETSLGKDLPVSVTFANGVARLKQPITVNTPEAGLSFGGGIRSDGNLDLPGTVTLAPQTIAALTGGKVKPAQPIPVTLRLSGPAWSPSIDNLDLKPAISAIVQQAGSAALGRVLGTDNAQQALDTKKQEVQKQAEAKAQAEQQRLQQQAADQQKKLEDEAKNRLKGLFGR